MTDTDIQVVSEARRASRKQARRWSWIVAIPALVVGAGLGFFFTTLSLSQRFSNYSEVYAAQRAHARVMFCNAPTEQSLKVTQEYLPWAGNLDEDATAHGVELLAQAAVLEERAHSDTAEERWKKAESACGAAGMAACSREALRSLAEAGCERRHE
ncbi:MAG: hypothetical protein AB7K71_24490 [Polyangiaceae bacterium]